MNRRILLIDADPGFLQTLSDTLSRYAFDVVNEADPDQAVLLASAEAPALLIVGVDEPDKHGFKVFQKCKKGTLAKVPIMLVTSTVTAESFAKHKSLKTHADEYLDKRSVTRDELLNKIDALITLGDLEIDDSLDIPVEVDDIPMADDGDMVLEEELGADDLGGDFGDDPHSPHSISGAANLVDDPHPEPAAVEARRVDSMVDADIEDAFGGMLGDDYVEPTSEPPAAEAVADPIPEPIGEPEPEPEPISELAAETQVGAETALADPDPEAQAIPERMGEATVPPPFRDDPVEEAVPGAIHDGGLSADGDDNVNEFDNPNEQSTRGPEELDEDLGQRLRSSDRAIAVPLADVEDFHSEEAPVSQPDPVEHVEQAEEAELGEGVRVATGYESSPAIQLDDLDLQPVDESESAILEEDGLEDSAIPQPVPHANLRERDPEPEPPAPEPPAPEPPALESSRPKFIQAGTTLGIPPGPGPARTSSTLNVVDLGLDQIAQDADRDQSGVHDRRELRKINDLERQLTQLKAELERARATAESTTRTGGREGDFLKLRENLLNQQKELQKAKDELAARDRELGTLNDRLAEIQQAKTTLEAKSLDLEQRGAADSTRVAAVEARERALSAQLATVQQELAAKTQTADHAETVRNQLERDVANERALRASSASDAERSLRVEREQMIARHQGELMTLRSDAAVAQEHALAALRAELQGAQAAAAAAAADAGRRAAAVEAEAAVAQLEQRQAAELERLEEAQLAAIAQKATELQQLEDEHVTALAQKSVEIQRLQDALASAQGDKTAELQRLGDESAGKIARLTGERDAGIEKARAEAQRAIEEARAESQRAIEEARAEGQRAAEQARADATAQAITASAANDRIVAELRGEIARLQGDAEAAETEHTEAFQRAAANQAAALAEQATLHNAALAKREKENVAAREAEAAAHAASLEELRAELERQSAAHGVKLEVAKREVDLMIEQHELAKTQLVEQQRRDADGLAAQHRDELAKVAADKQRALDDIERASAEHRVAVERAAAQHRDELAAQKEAADRELAELRSALQAAKKSIEDATA
ncbi:MAG: response regulator, partial [Deltaproteobacteria bacterium]|nr:response regulator [Deltaproteobacteria bacterium]